MKQRYLLLISLSYLAIFSTLATAQVIPDNTTNTTVNSNSNNFQINNGDRAGDNLFHSFSDFSIPNEGSAFFNNAVDIVNIFSRVTGGNISNIDGLLGANGTANLFLINPAGIIFGEGARLDIGGSFYGSTADSIVFPNGEFSATDLDNSPVLRINAPIGLNFRDNPGDIVNQSVAQNSTGDLVGLEITSEQTLALVGGNIIFETGNATARGGNIELGGLSTAGTVEINNDGSLRFYNLPSANIILTNSSNIDVSGTGGGNITINARNFNLEAGDSGSSFLRAGITADANSVPTQAGDITLNITDNITIDNSSIVNQVNSGAVGNAGNINITTGSMILRNEGQVTVTTNTSGQGGNIQLQVNDNVILRNNNPISAKALANASGGNLTIETNFIVVLPNNKIDNRELGGNINITAKPLFDIKEPPLNEIEAGGTVTITSTNLSPNRVSNFFGSLIPAFIIPSDIKIPMNLIESEQTFVPVCQSEQNTDKSTGLIINNIEPIKTSIGDIYPARGIIKTGEGKIILTSHPTDNTSTRTPHISFDCNYL